MESTITNFRDWYAPNFEKFQNKYYNKNDHFYKGDDFVWDVQKNSIYTEADFVWDVRERISKSTINMRNKFEYFCGCGSIIFPIIIPQILGPIRVLGGVAYAFFDIAILVTSIFLRIVPNKSEETTTSLSEIKKRSVDYLRHDGANIGRGFLEFIPFVVFFLPSERMAYVTGPRLGIDTYDMGRDGKLLRDIFFALLTAICDTHDRYRYYKDHGYHRYEYDRYARYQ